MLKLSEIRTPVLKGLKAFTGNTVIMADQATAPPAYPYYTLKITMVGDTIGQANESLAGDEVTMQQVMELNMSITSFSNKLDASFDNAFAALEWFKGLGSYELGDEGIVVVDVQPIQNRDTFINIDYERRHGFDVRLRVTKEAAFNVGYIEQVSVEMKE